LMANHIHLIVQPGEAIAGLGQLMKRLSGRQTRFVNRQESRTGTLWEIPLPTTLPCAPLCIESEHEIRRAL
jgi:putative transposase